MIGIRGSLLVWIDGFLSHRKSIHCPSKTTPRVLLSSMVTLPAKVHRRPGKGPKESGTVGVGNTLGQAQSLMVTALLGQLLGSPVINT